MKSKNFTQLLARALAGRPEALTQWYQIVSTRPLQREEIDHTLALIEPILSQKGNKLRSNALSLRASMYEHGQGSPLNCHAASRLYKKARILHHQLALNTDLDTLEELEDFFIQVKSNPQVRIFLNSIQDLKKHGEELTSQNILKGPLIEQHAQLLEQEFLLFLTASGKNVPTEEDVEHFKVHFNQILHSQDDILNTHRHVWKPIIANFFIAMTAIGFLILLARVTKDIKDSVPLSFNRNLFFAQTLSQELVHTLDESIDLVSRDIFPTEYDNETSLVFD